MAYEVVVHRSAQAAIDQIVEYLNLVSGGARASMGFMTELDRQIALVSENPHLHPLSRVPELANAGYRAMLIDSYIALYFIVDAVIHIAYVFHQSQDYARYIV